MTKGKTIYLARMLLIVRQTHIGYVLAGNVSKTRFQPCISYERNTYDALASGMNILIVEYGSNIVMTLEYTF
jgi:hypothetical protein